MARMTSGGGKASWNDLSMTSGDNWTVVVRCAHYGFLIIRPLSWWGPALLPLANLCLD